VAANHAAQERLLAAMTDYALKPYVVYDFIPFLALEVNADTLKALMDHPLVASIEEDIPVPADLASSVPSIGAPAVWDAGNTGENWAVAVLDTGVQWDHEFLGGSANSRVIAEACYSHDQGSQQDPLCPNGTTLQETGHAANPTVGRCINGTTNLCTHGTHVAGIAAGAGASFSGVAPGANIIAIQVFTRFNRWQDCGIGNAPCIMSYTTDQILGLQRVLALSATYDIAAVNMSLGGGRYYDQATCDNSDPALRAAVQALYTAGIVTVSSAGNSGYTDSMGAPGCISEVVGVGATTDGYSVASFSNSSSMVDLLAPGTSITSAVPPTNAYATYQGTSMSTAHVSGAWALLKSVAPTATITQVLATLQSTGIPVTDARNGLTRSRVQLDVAAAALLPPNTWQGGVSTSWNDISNWSAGRLPGRADSITIPASPVGGRFPVIDAPGATVNDLTIASGATVSMSANMLTVYGDWWVQGTGAFNATGGSVIFAGSNSHAITQTANTDDHFYHLQIGTGADRPQVVLHSNLDVDGDLSILPGGQLAPGAYSLELAGDWLDHAASFLPAASTMILNGGSQVVSSTAQMVLLDEDFSAFDSTPTGTWYFAGPDGWSVSQDINPSTSLPWLFGRTTNAPNTPDQGGHVRHVWSNSYTGDFDTWLFTPGLTLHSNGTYRLEFDYGARSASYPESLVVRYGSGQSSGQMSGDLYQNLNIVNTAWNTAVVTFTVPADGQYYLGFRTEGPEATTWEIALDNIKVTQWVDTTFDGLTVLSHSAGATLAADLLVRGNLAVNAAATLNLAGHTLRVNGSLANNGTLIQSLPAPAGTTTEFLHIQSEAGVDRYHGVDITPAADMGQTVVAIRGNQTSGCTTNPADALMFRCFEITPASPQAATLRLWYTEAERNGQLANDLALWHFDGPGSWSRAGSAYTYSETGTGCVSGGGAACWLQASNVSAYSPFGVGNDLPDAPTAIQLTAFSASAAPAGLPWGWAGVLLLAALILIGLYRSRA
jgi:hypothetical protein